LDQLLKAMMHHETTIIFNVALLSMQDNKAIHGNNFNVIDNCVYEEHEVHKCVYDCHIMGSICHLSKHSSTLLDHTFSIQFIELVWLRAIELS
jgi:hypothetical protein